MKTFCPALYSPRYISKGPGDHIMRRGMMPFVIHNEMAFFASLSVATAVRDALKFGGFPLTRQRASIEQIVVRMLRGAVENRNMPKELLIWAISAQNNVHVSCLPVISLDVFDLRTDKMPVAKA